ncbi:metallophosphoesterase [Paenibacillus sp. sgz500958]|uniref:metallophosphoesterase n=1 Tax=Paenibacillus sp. sgz500958 TaxID=3242475 RepID=UPI0036D21808
MAKSTTSLLSCTRKAASGLLLFVIIGALALSGCEDTNDSSSTVAIQANKPVSFWVATDTHYLAPSLHDHGQAFQTYVSSGDGKQLPYIDEITEAFVYDIERLKPSFIILSGDLTNNGERASHEELTKKLKRIEKSGTSVYVIPGNHDLFNPWARELRGDKQIVTDSITDKDFTEMYHSFGFEEALSRDDKSLSYAVRAAPGLWLLMIDSSQYHNNQKYGFPQTDGQIGASTLQWIDECVQSAAAEHASIITVMHHNLLNHTSLPISGFKLNNSKETLSNFRSNGLNLVLSGHIHMQDIRVNPEPDSNATTDSQMPVYDIATSAFAVNPHQYGAMTYDPRTHQLTYNTMPIDVEAWAKSEHISDPNLTGFKAYAEASFGEGSYNKAYNSLKDSSFTEEQKQLMSQAMSTLNVRYFAGTAGNRAADLKATPGYQLWAQVTDGFIPGYMKTMTDPKEPDNTSLRMVLTPR